MRGAGTLIALLLAVTAGLPIAAQQRVSHGRVFPPEDLGNLSPPDRDEWQQPDTIMDALGIADRDRVADVGAGGGWFTVRLARRVGPNGRVYAEDLQRQMLKAIGVAVEREGWRNVESILGTATDPKLPPNLKAVLMIDLYSYLREPVVFLKSIAASLGPKGRLGIVDFKKDGAGGPGPELQYRVDPEVIIRDANAAGLKLHPHETYLRYQYLLIFEK
jgi:ubiquinone/menaquinone biosynthesis C-methylase UbiE